MIYYKCKCGKREYWGSGMIPHDCEGCEDCGTTLATHEGGHKPVAPHEWVTKYDENTGKPYRRCKNCYEKEKLDKIDEEDDDVACNDCDNPNSKYYGKIVDGIVVSCSLFKDRS